MKKVRYFLVLALIIVLTACGGGGGGSSSGTGGNAGGNGGTGTGTQSKISVSGFAVDDVISGTVRIDALYHDSSTGQYSSETLGTVDLTNGVINGQVKRPSKGTTVYRACVKGTDGTNNFNFDYCQIITGSQLSFFINPLTNIIYAMSGMDVNSYLKDLQAIQQVTGIQMDGISTLQDAIQAVEDMKTHYNLTCTNCTVQDWTDGVFSSGWDRMESIKTQTPGGFRVVSYDQTPSEVSNIQLDTCNGFGSSCTKYGTNIAFDIYGLMYVWDQTTSQYVIPLANPNDISNYYTDVINGLRIAVMGSDYACRLNANEIASISKSYLLGCLANSIADVTCYVNTVMAIYPDSTTPNLPSCPASYYDGENVYVAFQARAK